MIAAGPFDMGEVFVTRKIEMSDSENAIPVLVDTPLFSLSHSPFSFEIELPGPDARYF
jgi:hypothetical protein